MKIILSDEIYKSRKLWMPRTQEANQCKSCPFLEGNDKEFGSVVNALKKMNGLGLDDGATVNEARESIHEDVVVGMRQNFACHVTVFGADMKMRPRDEHRQCPGASRAYKGESQ